MTTNTYNTAQQAARNLIKGAAYGDLQMSDASIEAMCKSIVPQVALLFPAIDVTSDLVQIIALQTRSEGL